MGQSLCEGVWGIPLAWGYDCVRETLSVGERATIESQLLRPLAEHMNSQMWETVHNIQCWHMAALATVGRVLGDDAWIRRSIEGAWGLERQLIEGVLADGWWWEGSPGYHFYTMEALLHLLVALRGVRPEVLGHPKFQAMLRAPLEMARSDGSLPALNDGWFVMTKPWSLVSYAPRYEMACGLWDQAEQRERLGQLYGPACVRDSIEALVFGPETCACEAVPKPTCLQEASGYAVLRHGPVDAERWLMLKFGPQGGYHGHFDKLGLDLHAFGKPLSSDLGTPGYGIPLNASWYRHTLSHNAVLLDGRPQPEGAGKIEKFAIDAAGLSVAHASVTFPGSVAAPYAGTRMDRAILWRDGTHPYFIDVVRVRRPSSGLIDLAWHHLGELDLPGLEPLAWIGQNATYSLLTQVQAMTAGSYHATWRGAPADPVTQCFGLNPPGTQIVAARVPYNPASETMSLLLRRSTAQEAWFVGVFEIVPPGAVAQLKKVDWAASPASGGPISFMVQGDRWVEGWTVAGGSQGEGRGKALASPATGQFVYELSE